MLLSQFNNLSIHPPDKFRFLIQITNPYQRDILLKIINNYDSHRMFLVDLYVFQSFYDIILLGGNRKGNSNKRERYKVTLNKHNGTFSCTCKDFTYRCKNKNIVCKHISFIVLKVLNIYDIDFFTNKSLKPHQLDLFSEIMCDTRRWREGDWSVKGTNKEFHKNTKPLDENDTCPICYDCFGIHDTVSCPQCNNFIHTDCMRIWLENNDTCVYCRSNDWKRFRIIE